MLEKPSPLDPSIVNDLVRRWQNEHDERARDELVRRFMPTIKGAARRWGRHYRIPPDDADQEAGIAFLSAIGRFNPEMGSLAAYTYVWARGRISRARGAELPLTVAAGAIEDANKVVRAAHQLRRRLGRMASVEEIAAEVKMGVRRTESALAARSMANLVVSTSAPIGADDDITIEDTLHADDGQRPDVVVEEASDMAAARAAIDKVLATFVPRHREVFRLHFIEGLNNEEIGDRMGIIRQRVHQIEQRIIERLREGLRDDPAVLALLGHDPAPAEGDEDSSRLLSTAEVEARTGIDRKALAEMVARGDFPRAAAKDNRGHRLWREAAVERWRGAQAAL